MYENMLPQHNIENCVPHLIFWVELYLMSRLFQEIISWISCCNSNAIFGVSILIWHKSPHKLLVTKRSALKSPVVYVSTQDFYAMLSQPFKVTSNIPQILTISFFGHTFLLYTVVRGQRLWYQDLSCNWLIWYISSLA